ncbi:uncharacterized protein F4812DRAFT_463903 [Daldinia caldariorum]|uniref:uncharacterized protein n=1 Tax=Daldinia caldariorum TaxID=326644 RepID=UPI00200805D0|nr:uncharacterized protein F4812DRAFT_463903 [Daldinia caldariorum]KAI1463210.1 hypothetical protein F4812DRAFT_463903 [Daldinia caldariorum]
MASASFDSEQRKLCQSLTPPASQPDMVSLLRKKALSAIGKSSDTAICIPSDVESDTEDENDESRELNNLQSCAARASIPDYLDLTGIEQGATESEAAIGVVTAPTVPPAQAEAAPPWPSETQVSHLTDAEPSQKSCEMNQILTGDVSASQDVNLATPPTSPESQLYPAAADEQELRPVPVSEWSNIMIDAVSDHGICYDAQGHPDSPSTYTHSPRTASPVGVTQASLEASEAPAGSSHDDAISEVHAQSPARSSAEPHQAQGLGDASCTPSNAASEVAEAGFESPSEAQVSSPSPSPRRSRRISLQTHKTMQFKDGDADSEGSGSEDGLNGSESHYRDGYSPSLADSEGSGSEDDDADGVHQGRKRRKVSNSASCSVHSTAASSRGSRSSRQRRSTTHAAQLPSGTRTSGRAIDSPTPSQATPAPSEANMILAWFEEWLLGDVFLKRITEGGKTTFQLQFDWDSDLCPPHASRSVSNPKKRTRPSKTSPSVTKSPGARWTPEEDETVRRMKQDGDSWATIQHALPHRSQGTIQVRYSTKLRD